MSITWERKPLPRQDGHIYEAATEIGTAQLWHRNRTRNGMRLKEQTWILYINNRAVMGSGRYRLTDAKAFAETHIAGLVERANRRKERVSCVACRNDNCEACRGGMCACRIESMAD